MVFRQAVKVNKSLAVPASKLCRKEGVLLSVVILALETSCDDTSAAVVVDGTEILSNIISSQVDVHGKFGGVVPEEASRKHLELINHVISEALSMAGLGFKELDAVAVTYGPGLVGALLVGVSAAKAIAYGLDLPLIGINHIEGHIYANFLSEPNFWLFQEVIPTW